MHFDTAPAGAYVSFDFLSPVSMSGLTFFVDRAVTLSYTLAYSSDNTTFTTVYTSGTVVASGAQVIASSWATPNTLSLRMSSDW